MCSNQRRLDGLNSWKFYWNLTPSVPLSKKFGEGEATQWKEISVNLRNLRETNNFEYLDFEHLNLFRISIFEFKNFNLTLKETKRILLKKSVCIRLIRVIRVLF